MKTTLRLLFQPADISFVFIGQTLVRAQAQFRSRLRIKACWQLVMLLCPSSTFHLLMLSFDQVDNVKFLARVVSNGDHHVREYYDMSFLSTFDD
ncbi:hypothetical protein NC652_023297 [Populus alba x Populus x berolinensis]|nr:hypothetical protein NC652_023297 [Populus alba x Populus x berolinensis]